ncbi:hypothetical protein PgNI_11303 [Pyricularia grisea]|uniref:Uncharacterized protein n=1 Tax=Pyricularia grisea TaxID=148305 RepID=A0A6P8APV9_PYRGI
MTYLPEELWQHIFKFLTPSQEPRGNCCRVLRWAKRACGNETLVSRQSFASLSLVCRAFGRIGQPLLFQAVSSSPKLLRTLVERPDLFMEVRERQMKCCSHGALSRFLGSLLHSLFNVPLDEFKPFWFLPAAHLQDSYVGENHHEQCLESKAVLLVVIALIRIRVNQFDTSCDHRWIFCSIFSIFPRFAHCMVGS